jgi:ABC-type Fe3+/spermidine/putrescine transport system ATPase subunit
MPRIELKDVSNYVLHNINLIAEDEEILALVGPNGAGKSTVLNVIAGLAPYKGNVFLNGRSIDHVPPHKRGIGYLFQDLALFPHLTVAGNIAYGLRVQKYDKGVIEDRVKELTDALHISKLKDRYPASLSGGEKQRVAIARAVAPFQNILLLDEPTASLDTQTAKYLRVELRTLLKRLGITSIFVIHDLLGAEEIADRIAIMHRGKVEQVARPSDILFRPATDVVSEFIGMPNILECDQCRILSSGLVEIVTGDMRIVLPYEGDTIGKIAISPHDIYISSKKPPGPTLNRYQGIVREIIRFHSLIRVEVMIGRTALVAELPESVFDEMDLDTGSEVHVVIKLRRLRYVE